MCPHLAEPSFKTQIEQRREDLRLMVEEQNQLLWGNEQQQQQQQQQEIVEAREEVRRELETVRGRMAFVWRELRGVLMPYPWVGAMYLFGFAAMAGGIGYQMYLDRR
jgi:hypothetical protein